MLQLGLRHLHRRDVQYSPDGSLLRRRRDRRQRHQHRRHPLAVRLARRAGTRPTTGTRRPADLGRLHRPGLALVGRRDRHRDLRRRPRALAEQLQRLRLRRGRGGAAPGHGSPRPGQRPAAARGTRAATRAAPARTRCSRPRTASTSAATPTTSATTSTSDQKIAYFPLAGGDGHRLDCDTLVAGELSSRPASCRTAQHERALPRRRGRPGAAGDRQRTRTGWPTSRPDPGAPYRNSGSNTAGYGLVRHASTHGAGVDTRSRSSTRERWDPGSKNDGDEMHGTSRSPPGRTVAGPALLREPVHRHQPGRPAGVRRRGRRDHGPDQLRHRGGRR